MVDESRAFEKLTEQYRKNKGFEAYQRIESMASSKRLELEDPRTFLAANQWLVERGFGKTPDKVELSIEDAPWAKALRRAARTTDGQKIIETQLANTNPSELPTGDDDEEWLVWGEAS